MKTKSLLLVMMSLLSQQVGVASLSEGLRERGSLDRSLQTAPMRFQPRSKDPQSRPNIPYLMPGLKLESTPLTLFDSIETILSPSNRLKRSAGPMTLR